MKTYVGELYLELPGNWNDASNILFRDPKGDIEVRIERSPVAPPATPDGLIAPVEERLKLLGGLESCTRSALEVAGCKGVALSARCKGDGDSHASLMEAVVFKIHDTLAVTVTATASAKEADSLASVWRSLLQKMRIVEVR